MTYLDDVAARIRCNVPAGTSIPNNADQLFIMYAVLLRAKGADVTASDVHDAWSAWTQKDDPDHEAVRPYDELPREVRAEDEPFLAAIRRTSKEGSRY